MFSRFGRCSKIGAAECLRHRRCVITPAQIAAPHLMPYGGALLLAPVCHHHLGGALFLACHHRRCVKIGAPVHPALAHRRLYPASAHWLAPAGPASSTMARCASQCGPDYGSRLGPTSAPGQSQRNACVIARELLEISSCPADLRGKGEPCPDGLQCRKSQIQRITWIKTDQNQSE